MLSSLLALMKSSYLISTAFMMYIALSKRGLFSYQPDCIITCYFLKYFHLRKDKVPLSIFMHNYLVKMKLNYTDIRALDCSCYFEQRFSHIPPSKYLRLTTHSHRHVNFYNSQILKGVCLKLLIFPR